MDEDDDTMTAIPSKEFAVVDLVITALDAFGDFVYGVKYLLCSHANWKIDRRQVENEMRAEIEFITSGGE